VNSVPNRLPNSKRDEFEKAAARLHALGPLVLAHFLIEIEAGGDVTETLSRYLKLTPELVASVGADSFDATATAAAAALGYIPSRGNA
jgi:hypothetical protein